MFDATGINQTAFNEMQKDYLGGLIYQLFMNADEHGSFDEYGQRYALGVRGISVKLTSFKDLLSLLPLAENDDAMRYYISKLALAESKPANKRASETPPADSARIMEISVFDTGPGLGLRWLSEKGGASSYKDIPFEDEIEAVETCFKKHATTKVSQFKGEGLSMALKALTQLKAFMALRTGRLSLYQDLSRSDVSEFRPQHRFPKKKERPEISGTSYSIYFRMD